MNADIHFQLLQGHLHLDAVRIPLLVRKGTERRMRIGFESGKVWLETPTGNLSDHGTQFLRNKRRWIKRHYLQLKRRESAQAYLLNHAAHETRIFGKPTAISFDRGSELYFRYANEALEITLTPEHANHRARCTLAVVKAYARHYLTQRVDFWAHALKLMPNTVRIKGHRSKWGSCSTRRNINLNWYLILVDKDLIDYVIVHELMHLREMNHSARYWALVADVMPDYQDRIARLRQQEWVIGAYAPLDA